MKASKKSVASKGTNKSAKAFMIVAFAVAIISIFVFVVIGKLFGFGVFQGRNNVVDNLATPSTQGTPATITPIQDGSYKGWRRYKNPDLGFSINASPMVTVGDYAAASPSDPTYGTFFMDLYSDRSGRMIEFLHLAVYDADLQTSARTQDTLRSDIYQVPATKQDVTVAGHKAILYYYEGDIRAALYLIEDGTRTFAINGFVHTKEPKAVKNYWDGFDNTVASFTINDSASSD